MVKQTLPPAPKSSGPLNSILRAGDLVTSRTSQPILCEVIRIENQDLIRVRGLDWSPGYSAILKSQEVRLVSRLAAGG